VVCQRGHLLRPPAGRYKPPHASLHCVTMNLAAHTHVVRHAGCSRRTGYGVFAARANLLAPHRRVSCQDARLSPRHVVKHAPLVVVSRCRGGARHAGLVVAASSSAVETPAAAPASMVPYYAAFLVFGCAVNTIGPMLPLLAAQVGLSPVDMAPLLSAKGAAGLAGSFLCPLLPLVRRTAVAFARAVSVLTPGACRLCSCQAACSASASPSRRYRW
jgi:hypothetical protein